MFLNPFFYQVSWILLSPFIRFYLYFRIWQKKEEKLRIKERFGQNYRTPRPKGTLIWLHAVSLGESNAAINLVSSILKLRKNWSFLITTNTITAAENIRKNCASMPVIHVFQPLDHPVWVSRFINYWQPDSALFLESDFWFNLITLYKKKFLPIIFASSQISQSAKSKWEKIPALSGRIFSSPSLVLTVDEEQKNRFKQLADIGANGIKPKILKLGSLKSKQPINSSKMSYEKALKNYANKSESTIILAASTHQHEEILIANAILKISNPFQFLVIFAPRHPFRASEIITQLGKMPRRSKGEFPVLNNPYFLSDSLGEMRSLYNVADIIILGGSFFRSGGHNPIEPALAGKQIICGQSIFKNKSDYEELINVGMIRQVKSNDTLAHTLKQTLSSTKSIRGVLTKGQKIAQEACMRPSKAAHYIISTIEQ